MAITQFPVPAGPQGASGTIVGASDYDNTTPATESQAPLWHVASGKYIPKAVAVPNADNSFTAKQTTNNDMVYSSNTKGPVLADRSDGHTYRIKVTAGVLGVEIVT